VTLLAVIGAAALLFVADLFFVLLVAYLFAGAAAALSVVALRVRGYSPPERRTPPPDHAFILMNPWSGDGKVERFDLEELARSKGAEVVLLEKDMDVASVLREAAERGADLLGAAGGDGTQALVAEVAAEHDLPMIVIPAGTRNHFALDLGLDRDDPRRALEALDADAVEIRVDLGRIAERPFVNNVSLGAYAEIIGSPQYREAKVATVISALPEVAGPEARSGLEVRTPDGEVITDPNVIEVANNPYERSLRNAGRRARLDTGTLGIDVVRVSGQAERRQRNAKTRAVRGWTASSVTVSATDDEIAAGVDGEHMTFPSPVEISSRPGALRVRVPARRSAPLTRVPRGSVDTIRRLWAVVTASEADQP
jgi:diacylglycerol kinase family enzyme